MKLSNCKRSVIGCFGKYIKFKVLSLYLLKLRNYSIFPFTRKCIRGFNLELIIFSPRFVLPEREKNDAILTQTLFSTCQTKYEFSKIQFPNCQILYCSTNCCRRMLSIGIFNCSVPSAVRFNFNKLWSQNSVNCVRSTMSELTKKFSRHFLYKFLNGNPVNVQKKSFFT